MKKNDICRAVVSGFTSEGLGVCRVDGCAVFVPNAVPDEIYDLRITHIGKHAAYGKIEAIISKSPHRVNRLCPYAKLCGGCDFWHMDYETECAIKRQRVLDALNRIGGQSLQELTLYAAPCCESYRNKAQFPVKEIKGRMEAGFYRKGTHDLLPVHRCRIQPQCADDAKQAVLQWARACRIRAYEEGTHRGDLRHIFVRCAEATGEVAVCLVVNGETLPREAELIAALRAQVAGLRSVTLNVNMRPGNVVLGEKTRVLWGGDTIEDELCGLRFCISPRSFYQVNRTQAELLYRRAIALAGLNGTQTVLDLYCGTGTITLCLAAYAERVIGVEVVDAAIANAKENAKRNGIENASFFCADAGQAAQRLCEDGIRPDVIVLDPPRKGISAEVIAAIARMSPQRVVYVSCDPATLARDIKLLSEQGYSLTHAEAVDLFPRCAHVETVALLTLGSRTGTEHTHILNNR